MSNLDKYNRKAYGRRTLESRLDSGGRQVPVTTSLAIVLGNGMSWMSFMLFGVFMIVGWFVLLATDFTSLFVFAGGVEKTYGIVKGYHSTNASENDRMVYAVEYLFTTPDGKEYDGVSYTVDRMPPQHNQAVTIEYLPTNPSISRIQGLRRGMFSSVAALALLLPLGAAIFAVMGVKRGIVTVRLLKIGKVAKAKAVSKEPTGTVINGQRVYKVTLEFKGEDNRDYRFSENTRDPHLLEDDGEETIIYDPSHPERAKAVDTLPGGATLDERGNISIGGGAMLLRAILVPVLAITVHSGFAVFWFFLRQP